MSRKTGTLDKIGPRQEAFCLAYIANGQNATQAAITAGYAVKSARQVACKVAADPLVKARIKELLDEKFRALHMGADEVLARAALIARADVRGLFKDDGTLKAPHELDDTAAAALGGLDVLEEFSGTGKDRVKVGETKKVRLRDPMPAIRLLAEHHKLVRTPDEAANAIFGALADRFKAARERKRKKESTK